MNNLFVRERIRACRLRLWEVAAAVGVSETTLIRWLRTPLSEDKQARILQAIDELTGGVKNAAE